MIEVLNDSGIRTEDILTAKFIHAFYHTNFSGAHKALNMGLLLEIFRIQAHYPPPPIFYISKLWKVNPQLAQSKY